MSYARANGIDSDVYVCGTGNGIECFCAYGNNYSAGPRGFLATTAQEMIDHLNIHAAHGDKVPERAFTRLTKEVEDG